MSSGNSRNKGWVTRRRITVVFAAVAVLGCCAFASASPLCTVSLQGRLHGTSDAYSSTLTNVQPGDKYDYRIIFQMAPVGTVNQLATINRLARANYDGLGVLWFDLSESASAPIAVTFTPMYNSANIDPFPDGDGYTWNYVNQPGVPTAASGGNGNMLYDVLAVVNPSSSNGGRGISTSAIETAGSSGRTTLTSSTLTDPDNFGVFTVDSVTGSSTLLSIGFTSNPIASSLALFKFTNAAGTSSDPFTVRADNQAADPVIAFQGLTLLSVVPEPATLVMLQFAGGMIFGCMYLMRRKRRKAAAA